jgi:hypothetical protein
MVIRVDVVDCGLSVDFEFYVTLEHHFLSQSKNAQLHAATVKSSSSLFSNY